MKLNWQRFNTLTSARRAFSLIPCIYVQTDFEARPIRIGKASKGLTARYRGGLQGNRTFKWPEKLTESS